MKLEHEPGTPSRNEASEVEATPLKLFAGKDESSALQMKQQSASHQSAGALSPGYVSSPQAPLSPQKADSAKIP